MDRESKEKLLLQEAAKINIALSNDQLEQFLVYYDTLIEWNEFMNLTAITEYEEVVYKHFVDSIAASLATDFLSNQTLIDIGTGAGFPGIPLKIVYPELKVTLLDSLNKRIKFLNEVINKIGLKDIETIHGRAEDYGKNDKYRERFDFVVSRAVANLSTLSEYCMPFAKVGGLFISYKSGKVQEELDMSRKAISTVGGKVQKVEAFQLPDTEIERSLVLIKKIKSTPKSYPRSAGKPSKEPIR